MQATDSPPKIGVAHVGAWQRATIETVTVETYRGKTIRVSVPIWRPFRPGQHVDVRLTAPDGYQAQRSYSIASAPETEGIIDLTVELVEGGEVSPWFHDISQPGDTFELRGPIGGPFTWSVDDGGPVLLIAGGSGIVPLMSMLRHRRAQGGTHGALLLYSSRSLDDVFYRKELDSLAADADGPRVLHTLTRAQPNGWTGFARRIDRAMTGAAVDLLGAPRWAFVCGPTAFVENAAVGLVASGVDTRWIRTERFGPSA